MFFFLLRLFFGFHRFLLVHRGPNCPFLFDLGALITFLAVSSRPKRLE